MQLRASASRICPIDWRQSTWHVKQLIRCAASHHGVSRQKASTSPGVSRAIDRAPTTPPGEAAGIYQHLLKYWPRPCTGLRLQELVRVQRPGQHLRHDAHGEATTAGTPGEAEPRPPRRSDRPGERAHAGASRTSSREEATALAPGRSRSVTIRIAGNRSRTSDDQLSKLPNATIAWGRSASTTSERIGLVGRARR